VDELERKILTRLADAINKHHHCRLSRGIDNRVWIRFVGNRDLRVAVTEDEDGLHQFVASYMDGSILKNKIVIEDFALDEFDRLLKFLDDVLLAKSDIVVSEL
jgi:hypothetical protein